MSIALTNRAFLLRGRPAKLTDPAPLELVERPVGALADGQALVRTLLLSVDPSSRIFMSDIRSDQPPVAVGAVMRGLALGRVAASSRADLPVGTHVLGLTGWQDYAVVDAGTMLMPLPGPLPAEPELLLGVLGMTGVTAWVAVELADPRPGDTVVVSAAAGAVGSIAGQLAAERGARVVGLAGGPDKCRYVVEELGFDACVDRHAPDWRDRLDAATRDGIDADIELAGGEIFDHVLGRLNRHARIVLGGMIADYSADPAHRHGVRNLVQVVEQGASVRGLLLSDHLDRFEQIVGELAGRVAGGRLRHAQEVVDGLENAPAALDRLVRGDNRGKVVVRVA